MEFITTSEGFFRQSGYQMLQTTHNRVRVFFHTGNGYGYAVLLAAITKEDGFNVEIFNGLKEQIHKQFEQIGLSELHLLSIVAGDDLETAMNVTAQDPYSWVLDIPQRKLIIGEGKTPDYYGLKNPLVEWAAEGYPEILSEEPTVEKPSQTLKENPLMPVTTALVALNFLVFMIQMLSPTMAQLFWSKGTLITRAVLDEGQWYRIITAMFLHADVTHIFSNMIVLYFAGQMLEKKMGSAKFLFLYLGAGIVGNLVSMAGETWLQTVWVSLGASGAVFGIMGALVISMLSDWKHLTRATVLRLAVGFLCCVYSGFTGSNTNHWAHIGGLIAGILLYLLLSLFRRRNHER